MENDIVALDLFAGTGWGVACERLGIEEESVELMPEAIATREANGMSTPVYRDVWQGILLSRELHALLYGVYTLLIGSPPCQTFSTAGKGAGRLALNEVIEAIRLHAYKDPQALLEFGGKHDMRTALVLTPLAYVYRDRPQYVVLEQVPTVLPVWEACAEVMREMGYSVKTAVLQAERYGVPQTRKRAFLVARLDGQVSFPEATHSAYYTTNRDQLDTGVLPWVSLQEGLGWAEPEYPYFKANQLKHAAVRPVGYPAPTITAGHSTGERGFISHLGGDARVDGRVLTVAEAAALQTYPAEFTFSGSRYRQHLQIGNAVPPLLAQRVLEALVEPAL
jgi:DNA (cytosine-5)-methyltransferase 1